MSYVRFGWGPNNELPGTPEAAAAGASSLYMFSTRMDDAEDVVECCMCLLASEKSDIQSILLYNANEADAHLDEHRKAGHVVHAGIAEAIRADFDR